MANGKRVNAESEQEEAITVVETQKTATKAPRTRSRSGNRPKLGQNFLVDPVAVQGIIDALGDISQKIVIEIGPGKGVLSDKLAVRAGHLIAIELDRVLAAQLRMRYNRLENVEIIEGDMSDHGLLQHVGTASWNAGRSFAARAANHGASGRQHSLLHHVRHSVAAVQLS